MQPTDSSKFTDKAWEAIVKSQEVARRFKHQQLEVEHLVIALLQQDDGLANKMFDRAGVDSARLLLQLEEFAQRQPRVVDDGQLYLGRGLDLMTDRAEATRESWQDGFISVEHLLMGFAEDERIGRRLLKAVNLDAKQLETIIKTVRGSQKVTDQSPESRYGA